MCNAFQTLVRGIRALGAPALTLLAVLSTIGIAHAQDVIVADGPTIDRHVEGDDGSLALTLGQDVQRFVHRFTHEQRQLVAQWLARGQRQLAMIRAVFRQFGIPDALAFTAMVESGFNPRAVSRVGAAGLWQLMAPTARLCGLRIDRWVDERFDPDRATVAAARHLRFLHERFGTWPLATAAYNAGEVPIGRAIRATRSSQFSVLARTRWIRRETRDFVPQVGAAIVIGRDPSRYGFDVPPEPPTEFETVPLPPRTDLRWIAAVSGIETAALMDLNPALVRGITPPAETFTVRVPVGATVRVAALVARMPRTGHAAAARSRIHHPAARPRRLAER